MGEVTNLKKVLFISALIVMCFFVLPTQAKYGGGSGTAGDPYRIYNAGQMNAIGADSNDWDKHFLLMADIDLGSFTGTEFNVIGRGRPEFGGHEPFTGTFDGNHHEISNFTYETALQSDSIGIFGSVYGEGSEIKNLTLRGPHVHVGAESFNVGCLAGAFGSGSIYGCCVEGASVSGANYVGGMFGICRGTIADCYAEGNISGSGGNTGGLAGCNGGGVMTGCYSSGVVSGMGLSVGGLVGTNTGMMSNCNSSASVSGGNGHVGGLAGTNSEGTITKCYSTGSASGYAGIGGLVGNNMDGGMISECHTTASATGTGWSIGGLVGIMQWDGTIANCYATGSVSGEAHNIGGLVGLIHIGMVTNCYSTGRVEGSSSLIGGLVGDNESGLIIDSFWDIETSGQWDSDGGTGLPTIQMQTESTFTSAGWDFITRIWKMCDEPSYPSLWWEICPEPPVYYVDADANGVNKGSSWANAYNHLQDALVVARYGDEIRVAQGIYTPDSNSTDPNGSGDREATFQLISGVTIKGGYAGFGEPDPDARDIQLYKTILSGDLAGNDIDVNEPRELLNDPCRGDNSYHVVTGSSCDESAVLDGFTITAGNSYPDGSGGGMYNRDGSPTITKCTFCNNQAYDCSGMYNNEANPNVTNCTFTENLARSSGAGMENFRSSPTLMNCRISGNSASGYAGMCNLWSSSTITNCEFIGNSSTYMGGGMGNFYSNTKLTNCRFIGNSASSGGGVLNSGPHDFGESQILVNCYFSENSATIDGGGFYNGINASAVLTNCTFSENSAEQYGGGIGTNRGNTLELANCILWGNIASGMSQIYKGGASSVTVSYSDVQGGWPGEGNIDADPCFTDADCHLKSEAGRWDPNSQSWVQDDANSPCIDAGDPNSDWKTELWPHGKRINMGVYGGTPEASMSLSDAGNIADLNIDGLLCYRDMKLLTDKWLYKATLLPEDVSRDGIINSVDFAIFAYYFELPAHHPNPSNGAKVISTTADLSWAAGRSAISHDVYFGKSNPPPFIQNQTATTFDPGTMDYSTVYYWRIDAVGAYGTFTGTVWSFKTTGPGPG